MQDTTVFVVSDHGAQKMEGSICVNEWLIREGYLTLLENPTTPTPFAKLKIDWAKTKTWGDGGYYSRIFLNAYAVANLKGRLMRPTTRVSDRN